MGRRRSGLTPIMRPAPHAGSTTSTPKCCTSSCSGTRPSSSGWRRA